MWKNIKEFFAWFVSDTPRSLKDADDLEEAKDTVVEAVKNVKAEVKKAKKAVAKPVKRAVKAAKKKAKKLK